MSDYRDVKHEYDNYGVLLLGVLATLSLCLCYSVFGEKLALIFVFFCVISGLLRICLFLWFSEKDREDEKMRRDLAEIHGAGCEENEEDDG